MHKRIDDDDGDRDRRHDVQDEERRHDRHHHRCRVMYGGRFVEQECRRVVANGFLTARLSESRRAGGRTVGPPSPRASLPRLDE